VAEYSDSASNYHGELLGAVLTLLILCVAGANLALPPPLTILHCDNCGVLSHGNNPISLIKFLSSTNTGKVTWEWDEGHAVESRGWANCTLPECLNDQADKLAKSALVSAITGDSIIDGDRPFEVVKCSLSGRKVNGSPQSALEADWGYCAAEDLFDEKSIV
jgi:hypothetical protein